MELIAVLLSVFFLIFLVKLIRIKSPDLVTSFNYSDSKTSIKKSGEISLVEKTKNKPNWKMKSMSYKRRKPTIYKPKATIKTEKTFSK